MFERYSHTMLYAQNLDRTVAWYCDKLGFEVDYHAEGIYASLAHPTVGRIALHGTNSDQSIGRGPMPYFLVKDLDQALADLKAKDIKVGPVEQEGESPRFADFWDCEGNRFGLEEM